MKKIIAFIVLISIIISSVFFVVTKVLPSSIASENTSEQKTKMEEPASKPQRSKYEIKVDYDGKNKIKSEMDFTYVNNTNETQDTLYFHTYPNMFKNSRRVPFLKGDFSRVFPQGFSSGNITILEVKQGDQILPGEMIRDDEILKLSLKSPVQPGEHTKLIIKFNLTIPHANFRFGYQNFGKGKITVSLGNWYPVLAVYKDGQWIIDNHCALGDCTYSEIADYTVQFTTPKDFIVAASGVLKEQSKKKDKAIYVYSIEKIRDFAASMSNNYEMATDSIDGIKIISYFHPEDKRGGFMALNVVKYALGIFNQSFGKYPYPELRIAEANYYLGGMEFPTFIMMSPARYKEPQLSNTSLERSVAHEVAHQWWYGLVGSDQINEPWMDEGITEFSTAYYFEKRYGNPGRESYFGRQVDTTASLIKNSQRSMLDPLPEFKNQRDYFAVVYISGVLFYEDLRNRIGEDELLNFLQSYLETFKYKNVNLEEFKQYLRDKNYEALDESFYNKWF